MSKAAWNNAAGKPVDPIRKEEILSFSGVHPERCMRCGKCSACCPAYDSMAIPPHMVVYLIEQGRVAEIASSPALSRCLTCMACVERCPRGVEPAMLVSAVRNAELFGGAPSMLGPEDVAAHAELPQQALTGAMRKYHK